ncbi:fatty acid desaturase [Variovorax sp. dw_308]|uniref:fatty acid desaturase n=1 Tax=Variovorax sp. dw_308 TaxID=2721546 RepID=UPI001C4451A1|nr:fatty acid desaturase [Variovorax sp. dw_308]
MTTASTASATPPRQARPARLVWWRHYEAPTLALVAACYAAWAALIWWHASLPGWLLFVLGGYVAQLHSSLQHESIHAMRYLPRWLRQAIVWPPLNLWLPYALYHRGHSAHHVNFHLTHPDKDSESNYHSAPAWQRYVPWRRALYSANQLLSFRLLAGPAMRLCTLVRGEWRRVRAGDFSHARMWLVHALGVAGVFAFVVGVCGMKVSTYLLCFVYPGMMLGLLRSFTEHRWSDTPHARVAIVESNWFVGLMYLYNNLHHVHHRAPSMPWYEIPLYFRRHRAEVLQGNGHFYYRGYGEIVRRFLFRPVFAPVHPKW